MRDFWIVEAEPFYCTELGRNMYKISTIGDEETRQEYPQSYLNAASGFRLPAGHQVPCGYYDGTDRHGNDVDYIKIDRLMIFDLSGNSVGEFVIDDYFNLYCNLPLARQCNWL